MQDVEARYRQRYLDLLSNERSRAVFEKRIMIVREMRRFLEDRGFMEVETPMLQAVAGRRGGRAVSHASQRARHRSLSSASRRSST